MNLLQITNTVCTDTNQATGVNRVVTQLCDYLCRVHQDNCFLAYFEGGGTATPLFKDSFCFKPSFEPNIFESFLLANRIDVISFNFAANQMLGKLKGFKTFLQEVEEADLSDTFWNVGLVQNLETSSIKPTPNTAYSRRVTKSLLLSNS